MGVRVAIGVGCRRGTSSAVIEAVVRGALDGVPDAERMGVYTIEDKADEAGLIEAAGRLGLPLFFVGHEALLAQALRVRTQSVSAEKQFGVPSVAEAAALAGAGEHSVLLGPRVADRGVTCAVARVWDGAA
jgi:cobalt-precorrin 5A hydrolase